MANPVSDISAHPPAPIIPITAILYQDTVTVETSDKQLCTGPRRTPGNAWAGQLSGCDHTWPFSVKRATQKPRVILTPNTQGMTSMRIETPEGSHLFGG